MGGGVCRDGTADLTGWLCNNIRTSLRSRHRGPSLLPRIAAILRRTSRLSASLGSIVSLLPAVSGENHIRGYLCIDEMLFIMGSVVKL